MTTLGLLWWRCFAVFGVQVPAGHAVAWYFGGELGKYLPGGVWQVVGRGELARRAGVRRSTGYSTTLISYAAMCVGAAATCGLLAAPAAWSGSSLGWAWLLLLLVPAGLVAVHPAVFGRLLRLGSRLTKGRLDLAPPPWPTMIGLIACSIPAWFFLGAASVAVTASLGYDQHPARVAFAAIAAWILGFLAVPIPAGAGVAGADLRRPERSGQRARRRGRRHRPAASRHRRRYGWCPWSVVLPPPAAPAVIHTIGSGPGSGRLTSCATADPPAYLGKDSSA